MDVQSGVGGKGLEGYLLAIDEVIALAAQRKEVPQE